MYIFIYTYTNRYLLYKIYIYYGVVCVCVQEKFCSGVSSIITISLLNIGSQEIDTTLIEYLVIVSLLFLFFMLRSFYTIIF